MDGAAELERICGGLSWRQDPSVSLADPRRFLAQVMTLGTWDEVQFVKEKFGWHAFEDALLNAPPGVFDARSWAYWHAFFGLPEAQLPRRKIPGAEAIPRLQLFA